MIMGYTLVNEQFDPEDHPFFVETHFPVPMTGRLHVNLLEDIYIYIFIILFMG